MRIITGKYKGRRFDIPHGFKARPTTDFAKENIFNVMNGYITFDGAKCLDLFAGTGSITLEMLSRGASSVVCVEADREHSAFIRACLAKINEPDCTPICGDAFRYIKSCKQQNEPDCTPICGDAFRYIKSCKRQFDFIFADPPYQLPALNTIPDLIFGKNMLAEGGVLVLEHGKTNDFSLHSRFLEQRVYGSVNFSLFR